MNHQGSSLISTTAKAEGVFSILNMRLLQRKTWGYPFAIYDVFCGSGVNVLGPQHMVLGTPIQAAHAIQAMEHGTSKKAIQYDLLRDVSEQYEQQYEIELICSDIRKDRLIMLEAKLEPLKGVQYHTAHKKASDQITVIHRRMRKEDTLRSILILDPNGPKQFPLPELKHLATDSKIRTRCDIIMHLGLSHIKRAYRAAHIDHAPGYAKWWIIFFQELVPDLINILKTGRTGFLRGPLPGDSNHFFVAAFFGESPPRHDWKAKDYVFIDSPAGMALLNNMQNWLNRNTGA